MAPKRRCIVVSMIPFPTVAITVIVVKNCPVGELWTTGRAKNYGTSVKKWSGSDLLKAKCYKKRKLIKYLTINQTIHFISFLIRIHGLFKLVQSLCLHTLWQKSHFSKIALFSKSHFQDDFWCKNSSWFV